EGLRQQDQVIDAIKTKIAHALAQMAVGDDVPGIEEVNKSIRISFTCALSRSSKGSGVMGSLSGGQVRDLWVALCLYHRRGMAREVAKADSAALENGAPHLQQFFRLAWLLHSICGDEADAVLQRAYLITQLLREDTLYLAARCKRRRAILRIEALRHQVAAQEQHGCFVSGEAQGRQEVPFHQGVAPARNRNDRHA